MPRCIVGDDDLHDALRSVGPARLELRLDENERAPPRSGKDERRRQDAGRGDERDVARDQLGCERQRVEVACVHPLEHDDARIGPQPRVELPVADVDRDDPRGAALQEAVGEPAGGGPEVDAVLASRVDAECVQGMRELLAAARDESRRPLDLERDVLADLLPRLGEPDHEAREHERLRLRPALGEPSLHEHDVEALLRHGETMPT